MVAFSSNPGRSNTPESSNHRFQVNTESYARQGAPEDQHEMKNAINLTGVSKEDKPCANDF